jgi:hypothetical protein
MLGHASLFLGLRPVGFFPPFSFLLGGFHFFSCKKISIYERKFLFFRITKSSIYDYPWIPSRLNASQW